MMLTRVEEGRLLLEYRLNSISPVLACS